MRKNITLLIPFYNEANRILTVLTVLSKVKHIEKIVCINDGSTDGTSDQIRIQFPQVALYGYPENKGKSAAIKFGLSHINTEFILLFDADLRNFSVQNVQQAIDSIQNSKNKIDALFFRQTNDPVLSRLLRQDILITGERIVRTKDLKTVLKNKINNYELELAINAFLYKNNKRVYWIPFA